MKITVLNIHALLALPLAWILAFSPSARGALVVHYNFEEATAGVSADSALNDGTATPDDSASSFGTAVVQGVVGTHALSMNGSAGTPSFGNQDILNGAPGVTLAAWVQVNALPTGTNISSIIFLSNGNFHLNSRAVLDIDSAGRVEVGGRALDNETFRSRFSSTSIATGTWVHLVGVIDYPNDAVTIYINGVAQPLVAGSTNFTGTSASTTNSIAATIGSTDRTFEFLNGAVDEVRIYNNALSAAEVAALLVSEPVKSEQFVTAITLNTKKKENGTIVSSQQNRESLLVLAARSMGVEPRTLELVYDTGIDAIAVVRKSDGGVVLPQLTFTGGMTLQNGTDTVRQRQTFVKFQGSADISGSATGGIEIVRNADLSLKKFFWTGSVQLNQPKGLSGPGLMIKGIFTTGKRFTPTAP